jgi:hypothetical protein
MRAAAWAVVLPAVEQRSFSRGYHAIALFQDALVKRPVSMLYNARALLRYGVKLVKSLDSVVTRFLPT